MSDLAEMRKQLRELRKDHVKPVSRMRKGDIISEIEKLRGARETTPASAAVPSTKNKGVKSSAGSIKEAKMREFPTEPGKSPAKAAKSAAPAEKKKGPSKAEILKMISEMSSDSE